MSEGMNRVFLVGHLGASPELRQTQGGISVLRLSLATTESYYDKGSDTRKEQTEWHRVTVFGKRAEGLAKILDKGSRIVVEGKLHTSSYDKEGVKHYSTEVVATQVYLAGGARTEAAPAQQPARAPAPARAPQRQAPPPAEDWG